MRLSYAKEFSFDDPTGGSVQNHHLIVRATELTGEDIPFAVNPREPDISKDPYKEVYSSLKSNDGKFLQKNLGITLLAKTVNLNPKNKTVEIVFNPFASTPTGKGQSLHGITNGGHTYRVITTLIEDLGKNGEDPIEFLNKQFISVRVITGLTDLNDAVNLAEALNAGKSVTGYSFANLRGNFKWLKDALGSLEKQIQWYQNDDGVIDVDYLIGLMLCFHKGEFPGGPGQGTHPNKVYTSKVAARKEYDQKSDTSTNLDKLAPLAKDILELRDYIQLSAYDAATDKIRKSATKIFDKLKKENEIITPSLKGSERPGLELTKPALLAICASYRSLLKDDGNKYSWNTKEGLAGVKEFYVDKLLGEQLKILQENVADRHREASPTQWGKDPYIWDQLFDTVDLRFRDNPR